MATRGLNYLIMKYRRSHLRYLLFCTGLLLCFGCHSTGNIVLDHTNVKVNPNLRWEGDNTILVISGNCTTSSAQAIPFTTGKYIITFNAAGTVAGDSVLPHFIVSIGDSLVVKETSIATGENHYDIKFELAEPVTAPLHFTFDNDFADSVGDRNIFLHFPIKVTPF